MVRAFLRRGALVLAASTLALTQLSGAARADDAEESQEHTVKTVAGRQRAVEDARFPSGHVSRVRLDGRSKDGEDLSDALKEVSGVSVRRTAGVHSPAFASVRGGNPRQLSVSLNGLRVGAPHGIGFDVGSLSLVGLDAADVYKGPAGVVHGSGALSGALDLRSELPRELGFQFDAQAAVGSFSTANAALKSTLVEEDFATRISAGWRYTGGDFEFIDPQGVQNRRQNNARSQFGINGVGRKSVARHDFTGLLLFETSEGGEPGPSEFQAYFDDATFAQDRLITQLGWGRKSLAEGAWGALDMRASAGFQRRATDYLSSQGYPSANETSTSSALHTLGLSAQSDLWLAIGNLVHAQFEARREAYEDDNYIEYSASAERSAHDAARLTLAGALSDELFLFGEALSLTGALRGEYIADSASRAVHLKPALGPEEARSDPLDAAHWTRLMPALGATWRAARWLTFKSNLAWTFRPPDLDELYLDMPGIRGSAALQPERARAWDAGLKIGRESSPAELELVWFGSRLQESIHFVARTAYLFEAANLGPGTSRGVEARGALRPHQSLSLSAHYTWTDAHLDAMPPGTPLPGQPAHQAGALANWRVSGPGGFFTDAPLPRAEVFARADWRSRVYLDTFANVHNPDFWTLDAGLAVWPTRWLGLRLNARNLADDQRGADLLQRPQPGRAFYLSAQYEYTD